MNINMEYYKVFYYVGKMQGITPAAEALAISQPAVSQAVQQLEKNLGTALFIRTSKGVRFTAAGEMLYDYVKKGIETIKEGENIAFQMVNLKAGEIKIGASDMTLQFFLLPYLELFHEAYPDIKVTVTNGPTPETMRLLQAGKIDFGVVSTPVEDKYEMNIREVKEVEDVFVAGEKFAYLKGIELAYKQLEELPIISLEQNTSTRKYMDHFLEKQGVKMAPEFELATSDIIVQFALRNLGVASVMKDFAEKYLNSGELFQLRFEKEMPKRQFCIATDKKKPLSSAAAKLMEMI